MNSLLEIEFKFPDWKGRIKKHERQLNLFTAAMIQTNRGMLFDSEGDYNGHGGWEPLAFRNGQVLSRFGTLRKSIAPFSADGKPGAGGYVRFQGETIKVGTTLLYARMMNDGTTKLPGGVLRPVRAKALMIPIPKGQWRSEAADEVFEESGKTIKRKRADGRKYNEDVIFRKSVRIPARPFDEWNSQDQAEFDAALLNELARVLNGTD